jgi:undecaprenyl-diphosphatase
MSQGSPSLDRWLAQHRKGALILAGALAAVVPIVWIVIQTKGSFFGDGRFASWIFFPEPPEPFDAIAKVFAALGHPVVATVSVAIVWGLVDRQLGHRHGLLVPAAVAAVGLNAILKTVLGPTPLQMKIFGEYAPSNFPSGHVVYATVLCGLLAWLAAARSNWPITAVMLLIVIGMGPSRVIDGAHWPSDVLAGYALGLAWTIVLLVLALPWVSSEALQRREE